MRFSLFSKIDNRGIYIAIFFIVALIVSNFSLYWYNRVLLLKSVQAKEHVLEVNDQMEGIWNLIQMADLGIRGYLLVPNEHVLDPYKQAMERYSSEFTKLENILLSQNFNLEDMKLYKEQYFRKMEETKSIFNLKNSGEIEEALALIEKDSGYDLWLVYAPFLKKVTDFEEAIVKQAETEYQESLNNTFILQIALILLSIPVLTLVYFTLKRNESQKKNLFANLNKSQSEYLFHSSDTSIKNLHDKKIIDDLITHLKNASYFIKSITKGNYNIEYPGLNDDNKSINSDNLTGNLIEMREQMKKVHEEDKQRLWANEGLTKFNEILRLHNDNIDARLNLFLSELIKYTKAHQGAIFLLNEKENDEKLLEMAACYAYGRKKYLNKAIPPGEGIIGQVYLEKEYVIITDIPENYIKITSGLGEATPNFLLVVPIKNNEEVVGILEIASFNALRDYEILFISKILETLASTIIMTNFNKKTVELLNESQQQAEIMRAQEEEMRQNIEELSATQEEMQRKERDYVRQIEEFRVKQ